MRAHQSVVAGALLVALLSVSHAQPEPQRRALLVGVTAFTAAKMKPYTLEGPGNDVALLEEVLQREPFRVPASNISTLVGLPDDVSRRPTHANIEREFRRMKEVARAGDQIVIFMAGHGSQQPADDDPRDDEPDGFDEIFLAADVTQWNQTTGRVTSAVVDDEIKAWVTEIRNQGAFVWVIVDSCQSGTMTRGAPISVERERQVPMSELVPLPAIDAARARQRMSGGRETKNRLLDLDSAAGDIAALYAANMAETTPEMPLPQPTSQVHGLFTYTIAEILSQSTTPMTYRDLARRVLERYRAMPRWAPTPMWEGGGLDREVLGERTWPDRPQMIVGAQSREGGWELRAGTIHGVTMGTILELFPSAGSADADRPIGFLKVIAAAATTARVEPTALEGAAAPAPGRLVPGTRARVKFYNFGDLRLKVALQAKLPRGDEYAVARIGSGPLELERALADLSGRTDGIVTRVDSASDAEWFVRVIDDRVALVPASGWQPTTAAVNAAGQVEVPAQFAAGALGDPQLGDELRETLLRIAKARNLLRLTTHSGPGLAMRVGVVRFDRQNATTGGRPLFSTSDDVVVRAGEYLGFRVKNEGRDPIDLTLLYLDARYGLTAMFPRRDAEIDNQIKSGEERLIGNFEITDDPLGWESVVAIAVKSTAIRQDFAMLAQPSLESFRNASQGPPSAFRQLLESAVFGHQVATRGVTNTDPGTFVVKTVTWRTERAR